MPIANAPPLYVADPAGRRYRVYDRAPDPAVVYYRTRVVRPGAAGAALRVFVREGDGW